MNKLPKIIHILYSGLGGHGSVVFSYLQDSFLDQYNHHLLLFGIEDLNPDYVLKCKEISVGYSFVKKGSNKYLRKFLDLLKVEKPDIIFVHGLSTIPLALFYRFFSKTKLILVEHASIDIKRKSDYFWTILGLIFCQKIVYLTQIEYEEAKRTFKHFFKPNKIEIIANGVDLKKFCPTNEKKPEKITIVKHCRFAPSKDLETLIKGFALLKQMPIKEKLELKLAGDGDIIEKLRELVINLALENEVIFTGILTENEIVELLNNADIYVNTSKAETLSTSIIQAMACGVTCVVSDIIENQTLIKDNQTGRIFEVSNSENLAQVLFEICQTPEQRELLGKNARNFVEDNFSSNLMMAKYQKLVEELL